MPHLTAREAIPMIAVARSTEEIRDIVASVREGQLARRAFDVANTDGFSEADIETLNAAYGNLKSAYPDADESTLSDMLNNAWTEGATADELVTAVSAQLTDAAA